MRDWRPPVHFSRLFMFLLQFSFYCCQTRHFYSIHPQPCDASHERCNMRMRRRHRVKRRTAIPKPPVEFDKARANNTNHELTCCQASRHSKRLGRSCQHWSRPVPQHHRPRVKAQQRPQGRCPLQLCFVSHKLSGNIMLTARSHSPEYTRKQSGAFSQIL